MTEQNEKLFLKPSIVSSKLHPSHKEELDSSGITPAVALKNGLRSVTDPKEIKKLLWDFGISPNGKRIDSLLVFPYRSLNGDSWQPRIKVFPPITYKEKETGRERTIKYIQVKGSGNHLYLPAGVEPAADTPLWITEGEKKALCLTANGFPCVGLGGKDNWKGKLGEGRTGPIPDLDLVNWQDREINIVFDADKEVNPDVRRAEQALAEELTKRGAKVLFKDLPYGKNEPKGADDYLVKYGLEAFGKLPKREFMAGLSLKDALSGPERLAISFKDFMDLELPSREYLIEGDFPLEKASVNMISAPAGTGKTMFLYEIARMVASGQSGLGGTCQAGDGNKVLYVDGEMSFADIKDRIEAFDLDDFPRLTLLSKMLLELKDVKPTLNLSDPNVRETLTEFIFRENFALVILDNLFSLFPGIDLNSATDWAPINQWLLRLRSHGVTVNLAHHTGKGGDQLGSVAKLFNISVSLILRKETPEDGDEDCCCFRVEVQKQRGQGIKLAGKKFIFRNNAWQIEEGTGEYELYQVALGLDEGKSFSKIAKEVGLSLDQVKRRKGKLYDLEHIEKVGNKFPLTEQGREWADSFRGEF